MPDRVISVPQATQIATRIKNKFDNVNGRLQKLSDNCAKNTSYIPLTWTENKCIKRNGTDGTASGVSATLDYIPVKAGEVLEIKTYCPGTADNIVFYDSEKAVVSYENIGSTNTAKQYTVEQDGYVRISNTFSRTAEPYILLTNPEYPSIDDLEKEIQDATADSQAVADTVKDKIFLNNMENIPLEWTQGYYIGRNGNASTTGSSLWATLDFIPIYAGTVLHVLCYAIGSVDNVVVYNKDKTVRAYYNPTTEIKIEVTEDGYIRLTNSPATIENATCYVKSCRKQESDVLDGIRNRFLSSFGFWDVNLNNNVTKKFQLALETGLLSRAASYSVTDFIPVIPSASYKFFRGTKLDERIAFYDADFAFVSAESVSNNTDDITIPANASIRYMRISCGGDISEVPVKLVTRGEKRYIITIEEGLLVGMQNAYKEMATEVLVSEGEYDLIAEYKALYGNDYFTNYATSYNGRVNGMWDTGIYLHDIKVLFSPGAIVKALYDGGNANASYFFSAFSCGDNVVIDGLKLDALNLRYGIHPDFWVNQSRSTLVIRNCDLHNFRENDDTVDNNSAIGAGFPLHGEWLFENLIVRSDTTNRVIRIHNYNSAQAQSNLTIRNCYITGNGHIEVNSYGPGSLITNAIVTGCSWANPATSRVEGSGGTNVALFSFNNELRS